MRFASLYKQSTTPFFKNRTDLLWTNEWIPSHSVESNSLLWIDFQLGLYSHLSNVTQHSTTVARFISYDAQFESSSFKWLFMDLEKIAKIENCNLGSNWACSGQWRAYLSLVGPSVKKYGQMIFSESGLPSTAKLSQVVNGNGLLPDKMLWKLFSMLWVVFYIVLVYKRVVSLGSSPSTSNFQSKFLGIRSGKGGIERLGFSWSGSHYVYVVQKQLTENKCLVTLFTVYEFHHFLR